jgi:hypothetical protein
VQTGLRWMDAIFVSVLLNEFIEQEVGLTMLTRFASKDFEQRTRVAFFPCVFSPSFSRENDDCMGAN